MMNINGHWETVTSLRDVSMIIREYYNRELADEMNELIERQENKIKELEQELLELELYSYESCDDWYDD